MGKQKVCPPPPPIVNYLPTRGCVQSDLQNINCEFLYRKKWPASIWMDDLRITKRLGPDISNKVCLDFRGTKACIPLIFIREKIQKFSVRE